MNDTKLTYKDSPSSSTKMLQAMVGIGLLCALMIVLTFEGTAPVIKQKKAEALEKAIFQVLPGTVTTQTFQYDPDAGFSPVEGEGSEGALVYAGYGENNQLVGVAVEAGSQGYADIIRILYGYDPEAQEVVGFHVLESKETPGLGDKIEKDPEFLANFESLDVSLTSDQEALENPVAPVKEGAKENAWQVEGITGATISSRAVGEAIAASTKEWVPRIYQHQEDFVNANIESEKAQQ